MAGFIVAAGNLQRFFAAIPGTPVFRRLPKWPFPTTRFRRLEKSAKKQNSVAKNSTKPRRRNPAVGFAGATASEPGSLAALRGKVKSFQKEVDGRA
jgi:hypothetical protein